MELSHYITQIGVKEFARKFGIKERSALSYKLGERKPRPKVAERIVKNSPVTWEGIYKPVSARKRAESRVT